MQDLNTNSFSRQRVYSGTGFNQNVFIAFATLILVYKAMLITLEAREQASAIANLFIRTRVVKNSYLLQCFYIAAQLTPRP